MIMSAGKKNCQTGILVLSIFNHLIKKKLKIRTILLVYKNKNLMNLQQREIVVFILAPLSQQHSSETYAVHCAGI